MLCRQGRNNSGPLEGGPVEGLSKNFSSEGNPSLQDNRRLHLILLLHDTGKSFCYQEDMHGVGHFRGHRRKSEKIAQEILTRFRSPRAIVEEATKIVGIHYQVIEATPMAVRRLMVQLGKEGLFMPLKVRTADIKAQNPSQNNFVTIQIH